MSLRVFVTVGSTAFPSLFTIINTVEFLEALNPSQLFIQTGSSNPDLEIVKELMKEEDLEIFDYDVNYEDFIDRCDLVIGHTGAGTTIDVLSRNKYFVSVINTSLMDNHQEELASKLNDISSRVTVTTPEDLLDAIKSLDPASIRFGPKSSYKNSEGNFLPSVIDQMLLE
ncbi:unnamed protein product [Moneuplotes crassus]|uniref:UDP-N-acetylglucosamine transferase subunit ALG13 n=1 Tax=Euplotes crassus TaxID=5936 RepID=A0AAD2D7H5_EUPCR|nr:unnamed protein product [Moneuplotes crassus]